MFPNRGRERCPNTSQPECHEAEREQKARMSGRTHIRIGEWGVENHAHALLSSRRTAPQILGVMAKKKTDKQSAKAQKKEKAVQKVSKKEQKKASKSKKNEDEEDLEAILNQVRHTAVGPRLDFP